MENIFTNKIEQIKSQLNEIEVSLRHNINNETVDTFSTMIEPMYWDEVQDMNDSNEYDEEDKEDMIEMVMSDYLDREFMKYISQQFITNLKQNGIEFNGDGFTVPEEYKVKLKEYYTEIKDWRQNHDILEEPTVYGLVWDMYYSLDTDVREQVSSILEEYLVNN